MLCPVKTATAVAHCREGKGMVKINGTPITLLQPEILRYKVYEPILVAGPEHFDSVDVRVRVKGGGHTSQVYAIRQAIAKAIIAYFAKYIDAQSAIELKKKLVQYDRSLVIADPRRMEPKKFGGQGARARRQKRCVDFAEVSIRFTCLTSTFSVTGKRLSLPSLLFTLWHLHGYCIHVLISCIMHSIDKMQIIVCCTNCVKM